MLKSLETLINHYQNEPSTGQVNGRNLRDSDVRKRISNKGYDPHSNDRESHVMHNHVCLDRPSVIVRLNGSDIGRDEARLMEPASLNTTKTTVTKGLDTAAVGLATRNFQTVKKIETKQSYARKTEASGGRTITNSD